MDIYVTGIGWVCPSSMGYQNHVQYFDGQTQLPLISRTDVLEAPYKPFGRMDYYSKLGFAAVVFAVKDAYGADTPATSTCIVAATDTGCMETDVKYQETLDPENNLLPSPAIFAYTVPNSFLGEIAILYQMTGESVVINEHRTSGLTGLGMAVDLLAAGQTDAVICGINNTDFRSLPQDAAAVRPGSLFCLIETKKREGKTPYGMLKRDAASHLFYFNDSPIGSLYDLAGEFK